MHIPKNTKDETLERRCNMQNEHLTKIAKVVDSKSVNQETNKDELVKRLVLYIEKNLCHFPKSF